MSYLVIEKNYLRHGDEHGVLLVLLTDIGQPTEDEHAHDDHQHQQAQLLVAEQNFLKLDDNNKGSIISLSTLNSRQKIECSKHCTEERYNK